MDILLVNQNWFKEDFQAAGHRVISCGRYDWLDIPFKKVLISWTEITSLLPADFNPELVIFYDESSPLLFSEIDKIKCKTAFYSVDTHHHFNFHSYLGQFFSQTFVAQKDYIPQFQAVGVNAHWLPLWASLYMEPSEEKDYGAVFIGTLNRELNKDRVEFFEKLKQICEIEVKSAPFINIFPKSEIVINQTVKGDLNFRVFESMMSGAMLLTERSSNGLLDLFEEGKHLVLYEKGNVNDAAEKISYYLNNKELTRKIAANGREIICAKHLPQHRAQEILSVLSTQEEKTNPNYFALIPNYGRLSDNLKFAGDTLWRNMAHLEILRLAQIAIDKNCTLDNHIALEIVRAAFCLKDILSKESFDTFIEILIERFPEEIVFHLAKIAKLSFEGQNDLALLSAKVVSTMKAEDVLNKAIEIITELRA